MMNQALKQAGKKSKGIRHDDPVLEHFFLNVWILGGHRMYEIFNSNMPTGFPSPSTIHQRLLRFDLSLNEASLNIAAVKDYLITNNAPLTVCLSEDATGVVGRVEYYAKTNSLIGFSGSLKKNGFPIKMLSLPEQQTTLCINSATTIEQGIFFITASEYIIY